MMCCLCLRSSRNTRPVFNENSSDTAYLIELHFSIKVSEATTIWTEICQKCRKQIEDFHKLYIFVRKSQEQLNDLQMLEVVLVKPPLSHVDGGMSLINPVSSKVDPLYEPQMYDSEPASDDKEDGLRLTEITDAVGITSKSVVNDLLEITETSLQHTAGTRIPLAVRTTSQVTTGDKDESVIKHDSDVSPNNITKSDGLQQFHNGVCNTNDFNDNVDAEKPKKTSRKYCKFTTHDDELIKKHIPMVCELCTFVGANFTELVKHFKKMHPNHKGGAYVRCCRKIFRKRWYIVKHVYKHDNPEYFKCHECKKVFSDYRTLNTHYATAHASNETLKYACDKCDKKFSWPSKLAMHKSYHVPVDERKFTCTQCPEKKTFASNHLLQVHNHMSHKRSANVCHVCAKVIRDKRCFEKHVRGHLGQLGPRVKCPLPGCDSWLQDTDNLKYHLRRHEDNTENTFECIECQTVYRSMRLLRSHFRFTHHKTIYSCNDCKKTFKRAITFKEHMAQHSGKHLYKCIFCSLTFNSNANMYAHRKRKHPEEWEALREQTNKTQNTHNELCRKNEIDIIHN